MEEPKRPLTQAERWVMWLAVDIAILFVAAVVVFHWGSYQAGLTCWEGRWPVLGLLAGLVGLVMFGLMTLWLMLTVFFCRNLLVVVGSCQLVVWLLVAWQIWLPERPSFFMRGFQDRVTSLLSVEELRVIRGVIVSTRPPNEDFDHHEVTREELHAPVKDSPPDEWSLVSIQPEFDKRWKDICERTEIEKLIGKQRVYLESDGDHATLTWGGALPGHWGIEMGIGKIEVPDSRLSQIRLADDIYLFHGE